MTIVRSVGGGNTSSYATVQDEGAALPARTKLNFAGAGVTATDDPTNGRTLVTIPGGSGGSGGSGTGLSGGDVVGTYGADPTGVASSTTAFQNAINAGDVLIPAGTYKVGLVTFSNASRRIVALGPVKIIQTNANGVFDLRGGWDLLGTVSSFTTIANADLVTPGESNPTSSQTHVTRLTMSAATTAAVGDIVKIVSDDEIPTGRNANWRMGEYAMVGVAASASTTVTLNSVLVEAYATNIRLARQRPIRFSITGPLTFDTDPAIRDTSVFGAVVNLAAAMNCEIGRGVEFWNSLGRAIGNYTYGAVFDGIKFKNLANRPSLSQYGYGVQDGGWMTRMSGCWGENLRHMYSEGLFEVSAGDTHYENYGGGWYGHISDCVAFACAGQAFDTHSSAYGTTFSDCKAIGAFNSASVGGAGFVARGRNITFNNCTVERCFNGFGVLGDGTVLYNCRARDIRYSALEISVNDGEVPQVTDYKAMRVVGGEFETGSGGYYTAWIYAPTGFTANVELHGVRFRKKGSPGSPARMIEVGGGITLRVEDVQCDWGQFTAAEDLVMFYLTASTSSITGKNLVNLGGSTPATSFKGFNPSGGESAAIHVRNIEHKHSGTFMNVFPATLTNVRGSYRLEYGTTPWWTHEASCDLDWTPTASATMPIAWIADPIVTISFIGTNGALTIAAIPTTNFFEGQMLNVINSSNGAVTITGQNTIAAGGTSIYVFAVGAWKRLV
jgi:hypothetical protein